MKECKYCGVLKDITCFIKDKTRPDGLYVYCKECNTKRRKTFREANQEKIKQSKKEYYENNKQDISIRRKESYATNKDNIEFLTRKRERTSIWKKLNGGKVNADKAKRRFKRLMATPTVIYKSEYNTFIIQEMYILARLRSDLTGITWHVDHIVPLQHDRICGLHVHNNLQVIPAQVNLSKSNSFVI